MGFIPTTSSSQSTLQSNLSGVSDNILHSDISIKSKTNTISEPNSDSINNSDENFNDMSLIINVKEDIPSKYKQWSLDYDKSNTIQSYNQLKSSAKYIFSKFKSPNEKINPTIYGSDDNNSNDNVGKINKDGTHNISTCIGNTGEIFRIDSNNFKIDVYDWIPRDIIRQNGISIDNKSLYLIDSFSNLNDNNFKQKKIFPLNHYGDFTLPNYLIIYENNKLIQVSINGKLWNLRFQFDSNSEYEPYLIDSNKFIVLFNKTKSTLHLFQYSNFELIDTFEIETENSNPLFDLKGSFLMYVPKIIKNNDKKNLTPVNLSSKKNLMNKLMKTFSNTVMDSMFMFSEITQQKIKKKLNDSNKMLDNNENQTENDNNYTNKENYMDLFTELYNTITKNSSYIYAIDLTTKKQLFKLSIPYGCSKISISPYDLQFLTVSKRGDEIFLWDFTNSNDSIVLMDKYIRGKTSSIIDQLEWGTGNQSILCLSRQHGSLHYFINESLRNYEDLKTRKNEKKKSKNNFSITATKNDGTNTHDNNNNNNNEYFNNNSWCLSNLGLKEFKIVRSLFIKDFIIALNSENNLLTIDIESGCIDGFLKIDDSQTKNVKLNFKDDIIIDIETEDINPEIEIESCKPFVPAFNNKKYKFKQIEMIDNNTNNDNDNNDIDLVNILSDLDSRVRVVKEYNIAGTLYENKIKAKNEKIRQKLGSSLSSVKLSNNADTVGEIRLNQSDITTEGSVTQDNPNEDDAIRPSQTDHAF